MTGRPGTGRRYRKLAGRMRSLGLPCWLCGRPINYDLPSRHPMGYEYDHYYPASRWAEFGYPSQYACIHDPANGRPSHRVCNEIRQNKMPWEGGWPFGGKGSAAAAPQRPAPPAKRSRAE